MRLFTLVEPVLTVLTRQVAWFDGSKTEGGVGSTFVPKAVSDSGAVTLYRVPKYRIAEAAELLGVSDDTVRRWIESGRLPVDRELSRWMEIDGATLADFAQRLAHAAHDSSWVSRSARNQLVGLVTRVITDSVMAQIEMQCGPHRIVSLMSTEAVRELELEPGSLAVAVVKSTQVVVETSNRPLLPRRLGIADTTLWSESAEIKS
jgi:molybdopterin-binding protein